MTSPDKNKTLKAKTIIEKNGFFDRDLYNAAHDRICSYVFNNASTVLQPVIDRWYEKMHKAVEDANEKTILQLKNCGLMHTEHIETVSKSEVINVNAERPIRSGSFIIGFIDVEMESMVVRSNGIGIRIKRPVKLDDHNIMYMEDVSNINQIKYIGPNKINFNDPDIILEKENNVNLVHIEYMGYRVVIHVHVKSTFESMGALRREINYFREYYNWSHQGHCDVVIGPANQGIEAELAQINCQFIEAPPELYKELEDARKEKTSSLREDIADLEARIKKLEERKPAQQRLL